MWTLWGYYAAYDGNSLPDFRPLMMGQFGCSETSVRNCHYWLRNDPEERRSHLLPGEIGKS